MDPSPSEAPKIFELPVHKVHTRLLRLLVRLIKRPVESLSGLRACDRIYARAWKMPREIPFSDRALQSTGVRVDFTEEELRRVPKEAPCRGPTFLRRQRGRDPALAAAPRASDIKPWPISAGRDSRKCGTTSSLSSRSPRRMRQSQPASDQREPTC
jgi:hypothetical protein